MRLYRASVYDLQHGTILSWHPTKASARGWVAEQRAADRKAQHEKAAEMKADGGWGPEEIENVRSHRDIQDEFTKIEPVVFPMTKAGVLDLLKHFTPGKDNG